MRPSPDEDPRATRDSAAASAAEAWSHRRLVAQVSCRCLVGQSITMRKRLGRKAGCLAAAFGLIFLGAIPARAAPSGWLAVNGLIRSSGAAVDWANTGAAPGTCPNGGIAVGGTGGLFNCGVYNGSSTPPAPPLLISTDPSIISAAFIVDPMSSDTTTCPSGSGKGDPTTVQGGTNDDALSSYKITTGSVPIKDELTNVYAVSHTRPDGHPELYFAAERVVNNGDSHIDFEFLQSTVTRTAACGGTLAGDRSEGDLLVAADFSNGGTTATPSVWVWHCAPLPAPQPPDGTICDPGSGAIYEQVAVAPATIAMTLNTAGAIACGGWACRDSTGALTSVIPQVDFVEGGISLEDLGFTGCFNTFLPHTRTSDPFTAQLADFTGPQALPSCRTPVTNSSPAGTVTPGSAAQDTINLDNGGAAVKPSGTATFFLCSPAQVTSSGCPAGSQVGAPKTIVGGVATSDPSAATTTAGRYCWRTVYTPDSASLGMYVPGSHTNATSECFNVAVAASLPNTGLPDVGRAPELSPVGPLLLLPVLVVALAWRRTRWVASLTIAGLVAGASPSPAGIAPVRAAPTRVAVTKVPPTAEASAPSSLRIATEKPHELAWRLVIPRLGVDAVIQPVGRDRDGAMAAPATLDHVGWFDPGALPGQAGDAVVDGHYGLPGMPAVFRNLARLEPGDPIQVIWPDGREADFKVVSLSSVAANAQVPGLFSRAGPARLSLITCAGVWQNSLHTYTDRLIVDAVAI